VHIVTIFIFVQNHTNMATITVAQIKKFIFPETGKGKTPTVRVKLPSDINKEVVKLQTDWDGNDAPNKEQLLVAIMRKGLNLPFQDL